MTKKGQRRKSAAAVESAIEDAIMKSPESLGLANAVAIRRARIAPDSGVVDVLILPKPGKIKIALVEAKCVNSRDMKRNIFGQILLYYHGARQLGTKGLKLMRTFGENKPEKARDKNRTSLRQLAATTTNEQAWHELTRGDRLESRNIALFLAFDEKPKEDLFNFLRTLRDDHTLSIQTAVARQTRTGRLRVELFEY